MATLDEQDDGNLVYSKEPMSFYDAVKCESTASPSLSPISPGREQEFYCKVASIGFTTRTKLLEHLGELHPNDVEASVENLLGSDHAIPGKTAHAALRAVRRSAEAEASMRRFAAVWEDLTIRIPFTQTRIPVPALDPLISVIPVVGEVVDFVIPGTVYGYNALKAGLGASAIAKGTALQMLNLSLHPIKYTGIGLPAKFVADWFLNTATASTHDFTARRVQAIEAATRLGLNEEDIGSVAEPSIQKSQETERKTQNSRIFKRWVVQGLLSFVLSKDKKVELATKPLQEQIDHLVERVLDYFYPLDEDRKDSDLIRKVTQVARLLGADMAHGGKKTGAASAESAAHPEPAKH